MGKSSTLTAPHFTKETTSLSHVGKAASKTPCDCLLLLKSSAQILLLPTPPKLLMRCLILLQCHRSVRAPFKFAIMTGRSSMSWHSTMHVATSIFPLAHLSYYIKFNAHNSIAPHLQVLHDECYICTLSPILLYLIQCT